MDNRFDIYLKALAGNYREGGTEHTGRTALENLLNRFAGDALAPGTAVQHEPQRETDKGAPDFKVKRQGMILGYVEVKEIGANLDKVLKSPQIAKYRTLSDNIVVTDYLHFIRIDGAGKVIAREQLAYPSDLESRALRINPERASAVAKLLDGFFSSPPQGLARAEKLAVALATRSRLLRDSLTEELLRQEKAKQEGRLHALFDVFRDQVFHGLEMKEFADAFAQMLAYGLFLAKLNAGDDDIIRLDNVRRFIPGSFRLIRELVRFLEEMQEAEYDEAKWVIDEILSIVNGLAIEEIRSDLSFRQRKAISRKVRAGDEEEHRLFERDPFIYFYEDFLKAYDKETRESRGVYYTPPPVVNFIIRAVDDILKDTFNIADGLADHRKVTVLDFAAGTGTFLLEVMQRIFDNIGGPEAGKADAVVREHMLKNLYGFEYLIAPYTIAHLKLSQYLKDKGHPLDNDERLQVYLTNTLEPVAPQKNLLLPAVSAEVEAAQGIKDRPILVLTGNPPYSGVSKNNGEWITSKIDDYKWVDGAPLGERKHWLNDDYVKFIRFAQSKMDDVDEGIVAVITNHSWLYNPTFRGMRQSLISSFNEIYILDLHGSSKPKEITPPNVENENVFDIMKGVAISIFIKNIGIDRRVYFSELWGRRLEKYQALASLDVSQMKWEEVYPHTPYYFLTPHTNQTASDWPTHSALDEVFDFQSAGMLSARDGFNIGFQADEVLRRVERFLSLDTETARTEFRLGADRRDWQVDTAQSDIRSASIGRGKLRRVAYRPFDTRIVFYTGKSKGLIGQPAKALAESVDVGELALGTTKRVEEGDARHALVFNLLPDGHAVSSKETTHVFPLYVKSDQRRVENLSSNFRAYLDARYDHHYSPEEILGYIYAVLYAPPYRSRYAEFLRIDFPRIPFPEKAEDFERMSALGWALVQAHLLRNLPRRELGDYHGRGDNTVEHVRWSAEDSRISINARQSFAPVPEAVWNLHIGGYQVIDKYLKSRKGRTLSLDEINHVGRIADALAFTIDQMERIDAAYGEIFPQ